MTVRHFILATSTHSLGYDDLLPKTGQKPCPLPDLMQYYVTPVISSASCPRQAFLFPGHLSSCGNRMVETSATSPTLHHPTELGEVAGNSDTFVCLPAMPVIYILSGASIPNKESPPSMAT
jgi:hypothetical protein